MAILISTPAQLQAMNNNLTDQYELANDIDMSGYNFIPIGDGSTSAKRFKGSFNGKGFKLKNLSINRTVINIGLFGYTEGATIKNVALVDCMVNGTSATNYVGAIAGYAINTTIDQCYTTGSVFGQYGIGGIVGWHVGTITNCWSSCSLVGSGRVGGIAGNLASASAFIHNSYAYGTVSSSVYPDMTGGLAGTTYAPTTNVTESFFNTDIYSTSPVGTGLTTQQFADQSKFINWDSNIWGFADYPYLKIFGVPSVPALKQSITVSSHTEIISAFLQSSKRQVRVNVSPMAQIGSQSSVELLTSTLSHIDKIVSEVQVLKNANIKSYQVDSYIDAINSKVYKSIRTTRTVESGIEPIKVITDIVIPIQKELPIYAEVQFITNQSLLENRLNQIQLNNLLNQSNLSYQLNQTNVTYRENRSEIEVV